MVIAPHSRVKCTISAATTLITLAVAFAGCSRDADVAESTQPSHTTLTSQEDVPPPVKLDPYREAIPGPIQDCPYLAAEEVERFNGQKVLRVQVDSSFNPPACFFYGNGENLQLTSIIREFADTSASRQLVDKLMPVDSTDPANVGDWMGGKLGSAEGAGIALYQGVRVVHITSDQRQSIKVQRVADAIVPRLV